MCIKKVYYIKVLLNARCKYGKTSTAHGEDRGSTPLLAILYYSVLERVGRNVHSFVVRHNTGGLTGGDSCDLK